jgi:hypothetical protein
MTCFLVESPASERDRPGIARTMRTLASAQSRLSRSARPVRLVTDGLCADECRLVCVIEAATASQPTDLAALAFLGHRTGREVSAVNLSGGQDPLGDPGSGVQP